MDCLHVYIESIISVEAPGEDGLINLNQSKLVHQIVDHAVADLYTFLKCPGIKALVAHYELFFSNTRGQRLGLMLELEVELPDELVVGARRVDRWCIAAGRPFVTAVFFFLSLGLRFFFFLPLALLPFFFFSGRRDGLLCRLAVTWVQPVLTCLPWREVCTGFLETAVEVLDCAGFFSEAVEFEPLVDPDELYE